MRDFNEVLQETLSEGKEHGHALVTTLSGVVIDIRHCGANPGADRREMCRLAASATGVPILECGDVFWWPPALGETWHPTSEEFLNAVRAQTPATTQDEKETKR